VYGTTFAKASEPSKIGGWLCGGCRSVVTTPREAAFVVARYMREVHKLLDEEGSDCNTQTESSQGTSKATFKSLYVEVNVHEI
jgi:hypothetical protein